MPGVPIEMPSVTTMVLKSIGGAAGRLDAAPRMVGEVAQVHVAGRDASTRC